MPILGIFSRKKTSDPSKNDGSSVTSHKHKSKKQVGSTTTSEEASIYTSHLTASSPTQDHDDDYQLPPITPFKSRQRGASTGSAGPAPSTRSANPMASTDSLVSSNSRSPPRQLPPSYNQTRKSYEYPHQQTSPVRLVKSESRHDDEPPPFGIPTSHRSTSHLPTSPLHRVFEPDKPTQGYSSTPRSSGLTPSPNRPNSPSSSRVLAPPITSAHRPTSPLAHEYKETPKAHGIFSWVRERKKSHHSNSTSGPAPETRSRTSSSPFAGPSAVDLLPSFASSINGTQSREDELPPTPASALTFKSGSTTIAGSMASPPLTPQRSQVSGNGDRGFVPPIRPNPMAKLSTRDKQDDASSFNLVSFRHVSGAGGSSPLDPPHGRSPSPAPPTIPQAPFESASRSRHNSFGSESSMTAGAFRQAMRKSATHLPLTGQSPGNNNSNGLEGPASRSSGYLPLPVGESPYNHPRGKHHPAASSSSFLYLPAVGGPDPSHLDKLSSSPGSTGSRMSFTDTPWAGGHSFDSGSARHSAGNTQPLEPRKKHHKSTPPRPPRMNPPPGRDSASPTKSTKSGDSAHRTKSPTKDKSRSTPTPSTPTPLYKTSKAPRRLVSSVSSITNTSTTTASTTEASSSEEDSDDAPLGLRVPGKGVGRKTTITQRSRGSLASEAALQHEETVRGKNRPSLAPQPNNSPATKPDKKRASMESPVSATTLRGQPSPATSSGSHVVPPPRSSSLFPSTFAVSPGKPFAEPKQSSAVSTPPRAPVVYTTRNSVSTSDLLNRGEASGPRKSTSRSVVSTTPPAKNGNAFGVTDSDTSDQEEEEEDTDSDDAPLSTIVRRPGSALSLKPPPSTRSSFGGTQTPKHSSSKSEAGHARKPSRKSAPDSNTLVDLKAPSTMSPNSQPLPLPISKSKKPTLIQRTSPSSGAEPRPQPLKSSMRPASRSAENLLNTASVPTNGGTKNGSRTSSAGLMPSNSSTSIFSQPPTRPFARPYGAYASSPAGSSTGGSSSGKMPLTPRDGSDLGSFGGSTLNVPNGRSVSGNNPPARKSHSRKGSNVTFEEPLGGKDNESDEERRKERRRSEAKAAIQIGNALHGPLPEVDDDDAMYPNMGLNMMGGGLGMQPGSWDAWSMAQQQQLMMMNNMSNIGLPNPLAPLPSIPPGTDPVAFMNAHQAAMMYAKQAYQLAVAQQAMLAAGEEWERSSNMGGSVIGGYGGGSTLGLGMPMLNPMGMNGMMLGGGSVYGGSSVGGMRAPGSVYGGSVIGTQSRSVLGHESDTTHHRRPRTKSNNLNAPNGQRPPAGPPTSWRK